MFELATLDGVVRLSDHLLYEGPGSVFFVVVFVMARYKERDSERDKRATKSETRNGRGGSRGLESCNIATCTAACTHT